MLRSLTIGTRGMWQTGGRLQTARWQQCGCQAQPPQKGSFSAPLSISSSPMTTASNTTSCAILPSRAAKYAWVPASMPASRGAGATSRRNFFSNGPGDPDAVPYAKENVRKLIGKKTDFRYLSGPQILGFALGGKTYKLKFGHHGGNQPVMDSSTRKVEITSQNHGLPWTPIHSRVRWN